MTLYLYVKQCSHCRLRYFGKTIANPWKYPGSGEHWSDHLKMHNAKSLTLEVWQFENQEACTEFGLRFSKENQIVESKEWANKIAEDGKSGGAPKGNKNRVGKKHSDETKRKLSITNKGKKHSEQSKAKMSGRRYSEERRTNMSEGIKRVKSTGQTWGRRKGVEQTEETKRKISEARKSQMLRPRNL